jgi:hypothetical protein
VVAAFSSPLDSSPPTVLQEAADEWGDVAAQTRTNTRRTLKRLDDEEEAAGLEW